MEKVRWEVQGKLDNPIEGVALKKAQLLLLDIIIKFYFEAFEGLCVPQLLQLQQSCPQDVFPCNLFFTIWNIIAAHTANSMRQTIIFAMFEIIHDNMIKPPF